MLVTVLATIAALDQRLAGSSAYMVHTDAASTESWPSRVSHARDHAVPAPVDRDAAFERPGCTARTASDYYFPQGDLFPGSNADDLDAFLRHWYSRILTRMGEPTLSCASSHTEEYRFLVVPTFGSPLSIRANVVSGRAAIFVRRLSGSGGYDPGRLAIAATRRLLRVERLDVASAVQQAGFWSLATHDPERMGVDGTMWVLEGRSGSRYHVVHRWSAIEGAPCSPMVDTPVVQMREICRVFHRLGGLA